MTSTLSATSPLFGAAFGVLILGESLSPELMAGTVGVMLGVIALSWRGDTVAQWPMWALLLPVAAAVLRVLANVLAKLGMDILPSPYFAGLVGYTVSFAIALLHHRYRRASPGRRVIDAAGAGWLVGTGIAYGLAILALNSALYCGQLVIVIPVAATTPAFVMLLGVLLFRERGLTRRRALAVLLVVASVVLVTVSG